MAAAKAPTLFHQTVSRILSSWSALQVAVSQGFGGPDSREKAQNLVNDIENLFQKKNNKLDPYDFASYLEDEVDNRFDLLLEDGSVDMIAHHICQCFTLLREGHIAQVETFLAGLSNRPVGQSRVSFAGQDSSSDEDGEEESMENPFQQPPPQEVTSLFHSQQNHDTLDTGGEVPVASDTGEAVMEVEGVEEGWTVVKKGGRKR